MQKLLPREEKAMQAVWKTGEGSIKAFLYNMDKPLIPYTTLASTIKNLEKKGFLKSRLVGNTYLYKPAISHEEYKSQFLSSVINDYFGSSYKNLVSFFVEQKKMSARELKEIISIIEKKSTK